MISIHAELTTQEAAEFLNVSRPYLIKLLDDKSIRYRMIGTHRRVLAADLLSFKRTDDLKRKIVADLLTVEAEKLGLGY